MPIYGSQYVWPHRLDGLRIVLLIVYLYVSCSHRTEDCRNVAMNWLQVYTNVIRQGYEDTKSNQKP